MTCPSCRHDAPDGNYCVRCGFPLASEAPPSRRGEGRRREFAASPHEGVRRPALFSTVFPHLPRAELSVFRAASAVGAAVVVALALAGLFPLAVVAGEVLMPLLMIVYLVDV